MRNWYISGNIATSADEKRSSEAALKITGAGKIYQDLYLEAGQAYTFSCFVNMATGAAIAPVVHLYNYVQDTLTAEPKITNPSDLILSQPLSGVITYDSWGYRPSATFTVGADFVEPLKRYTLVIEVPSGVTGEIYIDDAMLNRGYYPLPYQAHTTDYFYGADLITEVPPTLYEDFTISHSRIFWDTDKYYVRVGIQLDPSKAVFAFSSLPSGTYPDLVGTSYVDPNNWREYGDLTKVYLNSDFTTYYNLLTAEERATNPIRMYFTSTATQVLNGSLLAEGTIVADSLNVQALSSISANIGTVNAGKLQSQNYATSVGSKIDLNAGTFKFGGGEDPDLYKLKFDGTNLRFGDGSISWDYMTAEVQGNITGGVVVIYHTSSTLPTLPTTIHPAVLDNGWTNDATDAVWMSQATKAGIAWSAWSTPVRIAGIPGITAPLVSVSLGSSVIAYDSAGVLFTPTTIDITANAQGFSNPYFDFQINGQSAQHSQQAVYVYTPPTNFDPAPIIVQVGVREGNTIGSILATDVEAIASIKDVIDAITVVANNQAHVFPASTAGVVSSYAGSGIDIQVYSGTTLLSYGTTGANTFSITTTPTNITVGAASTEGTYTRRFANHSAVGDGTDTASITYTITVRNSTETETTHIITQSFSKSRAGATGDTGATGDSGLYLDATLSAGIFLLKKPGETGALLADWAPGSTTITVQTNDTNIVVNSTGLDVEYVNAAVPNPFTINAVVTTPYITGDSATITISGDLLTRTYKLSKLDKVAGTYINSSGIYTGYITFQGATGQYINYGKSAVTPLDTTSGFYLGVHEGTTPIFHVGDITNSILYNAGSLSITGDLTIGNTNRIASAGKTSYATDSAGFFLGYDTDNYKVNIGDATNYLKWTGSALEYKGNITSSQGGVTVDIGDIQAGVAGIQLIGTTPYAYQNTYEIPGTLTKRGTRILYNNKYTIWRCEPITDTSRWHGPVFSVNDGIWYIVSSSLSGQGTNVSTNAGTIWDTGSTLQAWANIPIGGTYTTKYYTKSYLSGATVTDFDTTGTACTGIPSVQLAGMAANSTYVLAVPASGTTVYRAAIGTPTVFGSITSNLPADTRLSLIHANTYYILLTTGGVYTSLDGETWAQSSGISSLPTYYNIDIFDVYSVITTFTEDAGVYTAANVYVSLYESQAFVAYTPPANLTTICVNNDRFYWVFSTSIVETVVAFPAVPVSTTAPYISITSTAYSGDIFEGVLLGVRRTQSAIFHVRVSAMVKAHGGEPWSSILSPITVATLSVPRDEGINTYNSILSIDMPVQDYAVKGTAGIKITGPYHGLYINTGRRAVWAESPIVCDTPSETYTFTDAPRLEVRGGLQFTAWVTTAPAHVARINTVVAYASAGVSRLYINNNGSTGWTQL